ncbi:MAG: RNA-directed DNA polymerase [Candidatus Gracilibacteria bacterium]|nr:RNA-directed DNA polymerase [Candidatus Gracilibacteria bacterium]
MFYKGNKDLIKLLPEEKSLFNLVKGKGLAIGNYSSQFFANIYLNDLDKYILNLGIKDYFRYVDDLLILGNDFKKLKELEKLINTYLKDNLLMQLAKGKTKLKQINHGLDFLGYFIKKDVTYVRKRVIHNFIGKINIMKEKSISYINIISLQKLQKINIKTKNIIKVINFEKEILNNIVQVFSSYVGHFSHANAKHLLKKILYKNSFLQYYFDFEGKKA